MEMFSRLGRSLTPTEKKVAVVIPDIMSTFRKPYTQFTKKDEVIFKTLMDRKFYRIITPEAERMLMEQKKHPIKYFFRDFFSSKKLVDKFQHEVNNKYKEVLLDVSKRTAMPSGKSLKIAINKLLKQL